MPVIVGNNLVLQPAPAAFSADNPIVGYKNVVTIAGVVAETEAAGFPALNLANPSTYLFWRGATAAAQRITFTIPTSDPVDYVGIAGHNLGTAQASIAIEARANVLDPWTQQIAPQMLADDSPYIGRFSPGSFAEVSILLGASAAGVLPQIAVAYTGKLLVLERRIYVGHPIMNYNRQANIINAEAEAGQFLGRIVDSEFTRTSLDLSNITPAFFRSDVNPWLVSAILRPFFFAWRPSAYPLEAGFAWATAPATVSNQRSNGFMQAALTLKGIVR